MNLVKQSFLNWIHEQENHQRLTNYQIYNSYYYGDHDVHAPSKVKSALSSDLPVIDNYCKTVVDTAVQYLCNKPIGIRVIARDGQDLDKAKSAEAFLYRVYRENRLLYENMLKTIRIMCKKGDVFIKLYTLDDGFEGYKQRSARELWSDEDRIRIKILRPDICFPKYRDDDYEDMEYCAIKWFDEHGFGDDKRTGKGIWKAQVFYPDIVQYCELKEHNGTSYSQWEIMDEVANPFGFIPIVHIKNTIDDLPFGVSDLQVVTDLQDLLNKTITDMALVMDYQAFQRVFILGAQTKKGQQWDISPGVVTEIPNENAKVTTIPSSEMEPFLSAIKQIVDEICSVSQIPRQAFARHDGSSLSGYALRVHYMPLENKCNEKKALLTDAFIRLNEMIFAAASILGMTDYSEFDTNVHFAVSLPVDEESQARVREIEARLGIKSRETIMQEQGIEDVYAEKAMIKSEMQEGIALE